LTSSDEDPIVSPVNDPQLKELFFELTDLDATECASRLAEIANSNPSLGQLLRELVDATRQESDFLETPASQLFSDLCKEVNLTSSQVSTDRKILNEAIERELQKRGSRNLGPFRLIRLLHAGSEGGLYLAKDRQLDRLVALRLLTEQQLSRRNQRKRIMPSIALAAKIRHPNIAMVLGVFEFGELTAISREWIQGEDMQKWAGQKSSLSFREVVELGTALLDGVRAVHEMGLVHGDIKPQNIILSTDSLTPILVDFGMVTSQAYWAERVEIENDSRRDAKTQDPTEVAGLSKGQPLSEDSSLRGGTPHFMAPELFKKRRASVRSDLFAVGVVLYWLSAKKFPYAGDDLLELVENVSRGLYRPLENERPDFPDQFCHLIDRLLAPTVSIRPSSVSNVQEMMEPWSRQIAVRSRNLTGRRRWLKEAVLWSGSIASGAGVVLARDRMKKQSLMNQVPPFLPEESTRYYFAAATEHDGDVQHVEGIEFSDFQDEFWGRGRLAFPAHEKQWGRIFFRPIPIGQDADYSLINLTVVESPEAIGSIECEVFARLSGRGRFKRLSKRKFELYIWDFSEWWKMGESVELLVGLKYENALVDSLRPPIGLLTTEHSWYSDPPVDRDVAGSLVGWKAVKK
jgi:serine/threonine protein kinase